MGNREAFVSTIKSFVGAPYRWGGQSREGFDCSGVVVCGLHEIGVPIKDTNAQGLFTLYRERMVERLQAPPGSLYFYGAGINKITHVMVVVEHWECGGIVLVGARGGGSTITDGGKAKVAKAFVDACWGDYWIDKFVCAVDLF